MATEIISREAVAEGFGPEDGFVNDRERIKAAFKHLRKRGYGCRANFMCCGSCAGYAMGEKHAEKKGVVYYSRQNEDAYGPADSYWGRSDNLYSTLWLSWSGDGYEIAAVLRMYGLRVEWNGHEYGCIGVKPR